MFKVDIHVRNGTPDVSKPISHDKMLHYRFLIDTTVNNYNLPHSLKGGVPRNCCFGRVHIMKVGNFPE